MSSINVHIRVSKETWIRYSREAQERCVTVGTHLRQRLEEQDKVIAELAIRAATEQSASAPTQPSATSGTELATLVELLLIVRSLAGPQRSAIARKEVERRGLPVWR